MAWILRHHIMALVEDTQKSAELPAPQDADTMDYLESL